MGRYIIHGSQLNGRDQWIFEADDYVVRNGLIVASGSFERKRHFTVLHVPLSSIVYIEEPVQPAGLKRRRLRLGADSVPAGIVGQDQPAVRSAEIKRRPGRPRKNPLPDPEAEPPPPRRRGRPPKPKTPA